MRLVHTLTYLIIVVFCSCGQKNHQSKTTRDNVSADSMNHPGNLETIKKVENTTTELTVIDWKKHQDSLRNEILKTKTNKVLKESFLEEMYIRNVVTVLKDSLFVTIPFDLHGPDCSAPDCYSTDVSFGSKLANTLIFPEKLQFQEHEHGCVEKLSKLSGNFILVEQNDRHVIYHSAKHKRTLVLFSSNNESGAFAHYYTEVDQDRINGKNVYKIVKNFNEEDKKSIYPFTSWALTTNDYENFLR